MRSKHQTKVGKIWGVDETYIRRADRFHGQTLEKVVTDGLASYPRAVREELGEQLEHQVSPSQTNPVEQSHRPVKRRYYPTMGFKDFEAAERFARGVDEVYPYWRLRSRMAEGVSLREKREDYKKKVKELEQLFEAA